MTNKEKKDLKSKMNKVLNDIQKINEIIEDNDLQNEEFVNDFYNKCFQN